MLKDGMLLFHGSYITVEKIDLGRCENAKDFGKGFYLTSSVNQAKNFIRSSLRKAINAGDVIKRLMPEKLDDQFCFLTEKAISCLEFQEARRYVI